MGLSLHHLGLVLPQNHWVQSISQCEYQPGYHDISECISRARQAKESDISQRQGKAVHIGCVYAIASVKWSQAILFRYRPSSWQRCSRKLLCHFQKRRGVPQEYTSEQSFRKSVEQYIQFYNEVRPHQTLKYQTPQAFEDKHYTKFIENQCSNNVME